MERFNEARANFNKSRVSQLYVQKSGHTGIHRGFLCVYMGQIRHGRKNIRVLVNDMKGNHAWGATNTSTCKL